MYTLYYLPGACSLAVHVLLNEIGAEFKLENVSVPAGEPRPAAYLKINPRGNVPTLVFDGHVMREAAAILIYLCETYQNPLLPASGLKRAEALEWLCFANSSMHPAYSRTFFLKRQLGDACADNPLYAPMVEQIQKSWDEIETHLQNKLYVCGETCTLADILLTVIANWSPNLKKPVYFGEKTKALFARVIARPSYQKALSVEKVAYKVA